MFYKYFVHVVCIWLEKDKILKNFQYYDLDIIEAYNINPSSLQKLIVKALVVSDSVSFLTKVDGRGLVD